MKTAIFVHGAAMRGAFAAGALYELQKLGIKSADSLRAVSSSTPTLAYFAAGQFEDIKQIWTEDLPLAKITSVSNFFLGHSAFNPQKLVDKVFRELRPLNWQRILSSKQEFCIYAYDFKQKALVQFNSAENFAGRDPWDLLVGAMTVHNEMLTGEHKDLVDANLFPYCLYQEPLPLDYKYLVIDNFSFWQWGIRQRLGFYMFRLFQSRSFPPEVKRMLKNRLALNRPALEKFEEFLATHQVLTLKYPKHVAPRPLSVMATKQQNLKALFALGQKTAQEFFSQHESEMQDFVFRSTELG